MLSMTFSDMNKKNRITTYFKAIANKSSVSETTTCNPNCNSSDNKTSSETNPSSDNKISSETVEKAKDDKVETDSDDDCVIIEKQISIVDLVTGENSENMEEEILELTTPEDKNCLTDSNDALLLSQDVDEIPEDNLDESFASLEDDDATIILSPYKDNTSTVNIISSPVKKDNAGIENIKTGGKPRKRVVIKRDYVTRFMVDMVKRFMKDKQLHNLFCDEDFDMIKSFHEMKSIGAQVIFARMYWLTCTYKRTQSIIQKYLHVNFKCRAIRDMIKSLKAAKLLDDTPMDIETWCELQTRLELIKQLRPVMKHVKWSQVGGKGDIIDVVKKACQPKNDISKHFMRKGAKPPETPVKQLLTKLCEQDDFIIVHSGGHEVFTRLHHLMYLGLNPQILREKRLNLLLLNVKRGLQHYPAMDIPRDSVATVFPNRTYFEEYVLAARNLSSITQEVKNKTPQILVNLWECGAKTCFVHKDIAMFPPKPWHHCFSPICLNYKCIELSVPSMRRDEMECDQAIYTLEIMLGEKEFRVHKKAMWYAELVQCHIKMKHHKDAAKVLEKGLQDPLLTQDDKAVLCDKAQRLAQMKSAKLNATTRNTLLKLSHQTYPDIPYIQICGKMVGNAGPSKRVTYQIPDDSFGSKTFGCVEDLAIHHYVNYLGYEKGDHWENSIITSLFALAFWDIIYAPMPGTGIFISPYQELPLDMFTSAFYQNRKEIIDQRLESIKGEDIQVTIDKMKSVYDARKEGDFSLFNDKISWRDMSQVLTCLGGNGLHTICDRMAKNYQTTHSGFPDLTVWNSQTKKIKFVEVKSHNDKLSFKQINWIQYLVEHDIETEVCFVSPNQTDVDVSSKINKPSFSSLIDAMEKKEKEKQEKTAKEKAKKMKPNLGMMLGLLMALNNGDSNDTSSFSENEDDSMLLNMLSALNNTGKKTKAKRKTKKQGGKKEKSFCESDDSDFENIPDLFSLPLGKKNTSKNARSSTNSRKNPAQSTNSKKNPAKSTNPRKNPAERSNTKKNLAKNTNAKKTPAKSANAEKNVNQSIDEKKIDVKKPVEPKIYTRNQNKTKKIIVDPSKAGPSCSYSSAPVTRSSSNKPTIQQPLEPLTDINPSESNQTLQQSTAPHLINLQTGKRIILKKVDKKSINTTIGPKFIIKPTAPQIINSQIVHQPSNSTAYPRFVVGPTIPHNTQKIGQQNTIMIQSPSPNNSQIVNKPVQIVVGSTASQTISNRMGLESTNRQTISQQIITSSQTTIWPTDSQIINSKSLTLASTKQPLKILKFPSQPANISAAPMGVNSQTSQQSVTISTGQQSFTNSTIAQSSSNSAVPQKILLGPISLQPQRSVNGPQFIIKPIALSSNPTDVTNQQTLNSTAVLNRQPIEQSTNTRKVVVKKLFKVQSLNSGPVAICSNAVKDQNSLTSQQIVSESQIVRRIVVKKSLPVNESAVQNSLLKRSPKKNLTVRNSPTKRLSTQKSTGSLKTQESPTKKLKTQKSPTKRPNLQGSPTKNANMQKSSSNSPITKYFSPIKTSSPCTPTKISSPHTPAKSPSSSQSSPNKSPYKNLSSRRKISLSLTRRRLTDLDK